MNTTKEKAHESTLAKQLTKTLAELDAGVIELKQAEAISNAAGKLIKLELGKLEYECRRAKIANLRRVPFFE